MDPLSISASIAGLLSFIKDAVEIIQDIKGASKDYKVLATRFQILGESLDSIKSRVDQVSKVEAELKTGVFGRHNSVDRLFTRYYKAVEKKPDGSKGLYLQAKDRLDELFSEEFVKVALRRRDKLFWTWKKGDIASSLDAAIEIVKLLRDYLHDDDVQLQQATYIAVMKNQYVSEENEIVQILNWISPPELQPTDVVASKFSSVLPIPDPFILSNPTYHQWVNDAASTHWHLNCYGKPGTGKSHRARTVIFDLSNRFRRKGIPVLFIMFNQANESQQSLRNVYRRLLRQLLSQRSNQGVPDPIKQLWNQGRLEGHDGPSEREAREQLLSELGKLPQKFIVADALDEATGSFQTIHGALSDLRKQANATIFSTTRLDLVEFADIKIVCNGCLKIAQELYWTCNLCKGIMAARIDLCRECYQDKGERCSDSSHTMHIAEKVEIEVQPTPKEIKAFVKDSLKKELDMDDSYGVDSARYSGFAPTLVSIRKKLGQEWDTIPDLVRSVAGDSYLVADLIVKRFKHQKHPEGARRLLEELRSGISLSYDDQYREMLDLCLNKRGPESRKIAYDHLAVVSCAHDVLSFEQLSHAVAIQLGNRVIEDFIDRCSLQQTVRKETNGLLLIGDFGNPEHETVMFFHRTFSNYLKKHGQAWFPDRDQMMFNACLAYLRLDVFKTPFKSPKELDRVLEEYPFAGYAARFWGEHLRNIGDGKQLLENTNTLRLLEVLNDRDRKTAIMQISLHVLSNADLAWDVQENLSLLHICAFHGLANVCDMLLTYGENINCLEETYGQTALHYACRNGHIEVAKVLLAQHAEANLVSDKERTPLMEAIENEHMALVELLLQYPSVDVNIDAGGNRKLTALILAAEKGKTALVEMLIGHGKIQVNKCDGFGCTALAWAVRCPSVECVDVLLKHPDIDPSIQDSRIGMAVDYLAYYGGPKFKGLDVKILKSFLQYDGLPTLRGQSLQYLIEDNRNNLVELLLERQTYDAWRDEHGRSLLHITATSGSELALDLIYDQFSKAKNFDINLVDNFGCTPLHAACSRIGIDGGSMALRLLELGANFSAENLLHQTAIEVAYRSVSLTDRDAVTAALKPHLPKNLGTIDQNAPAYLESLVMLGDIDQLKSALQHEPTPLRSTPYPYTSWTMLHMTMHTWTGPRPDILELLLPRALPYLNAVSDVGRTCLHAAAMKGSSASIALLIKAKIMLDIEDKWGETAFELAQKGDPACAFALLKAGAKVRKETVKKDLLHATVSTGDVMVVKKLVDLGVDVYHKRNGTGPTALTYAKDRYSIAVDQVKTEMAADPKYMNQQNFPDIMAFDQAARDQPKAKVFNDIVEILQQARRNESRGRFMHRDFTALIDSLQDQDIVAPLNRRTLSEQSPPPPYSTPVSRANSVAAAKRHPSSAGLPNGKTEESNMTNVIGVQLINVQKNDRLMITVIAVVGTVAIAWMWLFLHYAVQLYGPSNIKAEL